MMAGISRCFTLKSAAYPPMNGFSILSIAGTLKIGGSDAKRLCALILGGCEGACLGIDEPLRWFDAGKALVATPCKVLGNLLTMDMLDTGFLTRLPRHYVAARGSFASELAAAGRDFVQSFELWPLWTTLAFNDILSRYRGSILGPFWITLSTGVFVIGIGLVYGSLMHVPTDKYVPWMAVGVVIWNFISSTILESGDTFIHSAVIIRSGSLPLPIFVWRVICRSIVNLAHQITVIVAVALWFHFLLKINLPMFVAGMVLVIVNVSWVSFFTAIAAARFRDIQQVNASLIQLIFFVSPVIWIPNEMNGVKSIILNLNPVYHLLNVTRNPILGMAVPLHSIGFLMVLAVVGWALSFMLYASVRRRIVHYL
jgi:ABC-type polysaccharide/polyol phosphate export permease